MSLSSRLPAAILCLLCQAVFACSASAAARYGEQFYRLEAEPVARTAAAGPDLPEPDLVSRQILQSQLETVELEAGPYTPALAEPLIDLARAHRRAGQLEQASRLYQRALHVLRINQGLHGEHQLALLQELLEIQREQGDWAGLDDRYDQYYRAASAADQASLPRLLEYLSWQQTALQLGVDSREERRLLGLLDLHQELLASSDSLPVDAAWPLLRSQLATLHLLRAWQAPVVIEHSAGLRGSLSARPPMELSHHEQRLINLQRGAVAQGILLLEGFLARADLQEVELRAAAWLALADWEQWNGRQQTALQRYAGLVRWLGEQGRDDLRQAWFDEPVELPDNGVFRRPGQDTQRLVAAYDVSPEGRARSVQTQGDGEGQRGLAIRLSRQLTATRFRPAFGPAGDARAAQGLQRDYLVVRRP